MRTGDANAMGDAVVRFLEHNLPPFAKGRDARRPRKARLSIRGCYRFGLTTPNVLEMWMRDGNWYYKEGSKGPILEDCSAPFWLSVVPILLACPFGRRRKMSRR